MNLTFQVLKNDLIEKFGLIDSESSGGSPEVSCVELCRRITDHTKADPQVVHKTITDFINRGYLHVQASAGGRSWSWAR